MKRLIKKTKQKIFNILLYSITRNKRIFVINGLRRSGNHACINWLINSLEEKSDVQLSELKEWHFFVSTSEKTVFFNEVNALSMSERINLILQHREKIKGASNIIFSFEDALPHEYEYYFDDKVIKIAIKRSLLNLIASRLQRAIKQASIGLEKGDMKIDEKFFNRYSFLCNAEKNNYYLWDYDEWLHNHSYRKEFLNKLQLSFDSKPSISEHGGGSSFTGTSSIPQSLDLSSRYIHMEWPDRIIKLLEKPKVLSFLTKTEKEFLEKAKALRV